MRTLHLKLFLFILFPFYIALFTAAPAEAGTKSTQCQIAVVNTLKNGKVKKRVFNSNAENESECAARAKDFDVNFFPPKIEKTEVTYEWGTK